MHLAVVDGPHAVAVPAAVGGLVNQVGGGAFEGVLVPGAVLGERLHGLPVLGAVQADQGLGDGVLLDIEYQAGQPLGEAAEAGVGEGIGARPEQRLPVSPQLRSLHRHLSWLGISALFKGADILATGGSLVDPPCRSGSTSNAGTRAHDFRETSV